MSYTESKYAPYDFANRRHIGPSPVEMEERLAAVGVRALDELIDQTVPPSIRQAQPLSWAPLAEHELLAMMKEVGAKNRVMTSLIGQTASLIQAGGSLLDAGGGFSADPENEDPLSTQR